MKFLGRHGWACNRFPLTVPRLGLCAVSEHSSRSQSQAYSFQAGLSVSTQDTPSLTMGDGPAHRLTALYRRQCAGCSSASTCAMLLRSTHHQQTKTRADNRHSNQTTPTGGSPALSKSATGRQLQAGEPTKLCTRNSTAVAAIQVEPANSISDADRCQRQTNSIATERSSQH